MHDDLFELSIKRGDGNLRYASIDLKPTKTVHFPNPNKGGMVVSWPITKITSYDDLNGDGEFDWILKNIPSKERPNGPNDIREFIIVDDSIIEIRHERTKPGYRKEFITTKGERYVMSPEGWMKK